MTPRATIQLRSSPPTFPASSIRVSLAAAISVSYSQSRIRSRIQAAQSGSGTPKVSSTSTLGPPISRLREPLVTTATRAERFHVRMALAIERPSAWQRRADAIDEDRNDRQRHCRRHEMQWDERAVVELEIDGRGEVEAVLYQ